MPDSFREAHHRLAEERLPEEALAVPVLGRGRRSSLLSGAGQELLRVPSGRAASGLRTVAMSTTSAWRVFLAKYP